MSKLSLENLVRENKVEAGRIKLTKEILQKVKPSKIILIFTAGLISLGMTLGFSNNAHSNDSKYNTTSTEQSLTNPLSVNSIITYPNNLYGTKDNIALKTISYKVWPNDAASQSCTYSWTSQSSGITSNLSTVFAVNDMIAWAAGATSTVRKTINGGLTWTNGDPNPGVIIGSSVVNINALDANTAFCTSYDANGTYLYKTTNGGTNWVQVFTQAGGFIDGIQMISPTEGYALGDPVTGKWTVLKTTDGGNTWVRMAMEPTAIAADAGWNNSFLIIGTNIWFGTSGTKVYHSTDLGLTWSFGATIGTVNTYSLHYNNTLNGLAGGNAMVKSTDGGATYSVTGSPGTISNIINGLEGTETDWWAIRTDANIYKSTNQGTSWTTAYTQTGAIFNDIDFAIVNNCPVGWVVGNGGAIAKMSSVTGISNYNSEVPTSYSLNQNFPNPFNPTSNIFFAIPKSGLVTLKIYDMLGKEVKTLVNEFKNAGNYIVGFNASNLSSGAYFYKIESGNFVDTKKMLLIK